MSAIWGAIHLLGENIPIDTEERMKGPYKTCVLDEIQCVKGEQFFLSCGTKYVTKEDRYELLPISEDTSGISFVADVYLDNREEIMELLQVNQEEAKLWSDGRLLLEGYKRWGIYGLNHFLGAYCFVAYHALEKKVVLVSDVVRSRCLYYSIQNNILYFSSLIEPILLMQGSKVSINERWISDFIALEGLALMTEWVETPYDGIFKIEPAQVLIATSNHVSKETYWNPVKDVKKVRYGSDEEYQNAFLEIFNQCVADSIRAQEKTGILLSGGLDSTSIACIAADRLKRDGKELYSYTQVPKAGYIGEREHYYNVNEKEVAGLTIAQLGNVIGNFISHEEMNAWNAIDEMLSIFEIPYKSVQNVPWITYTLKKAYQDGCNVVLNGQYGNATISYGNINEYLLSLLRGGKVGKLKKEMECICKKYNISRKRVLKTIIKDTTLYNLYKGNVSTDFFKYSYIKPALVTKWNIKKRIRENGRRAIESMSSMKESRNFMYYKLALSQIGEFETKQSLRTGVLIRDPSRDKRMIEFCLGLPAEQFVKEGEGRRLINQYMKSIVPGEVLQMSRRKKGLQSADEIYRLETEWNKIYQGIVECMNTEEARNYLNLEKVKGDLLQVQEQINDKDEAAVVHFISTCICMKFLQKR